MFRMFFTSFIHASGMTIEFLEIFEHVQSYYDHSHQHAIHNMTIL